MCEKKPTVERDHRKSASRRQALVERMDLGGPDGRKSVARSLRRVPSFHEQSKTNRTVAPLGRF